MIVLDASAALDWLLQSPRADAIERRIVDRDERIHVPHLFDVEVARVLRRLVQLEQVGARRATQCLDDLALLSAVRHSHVGLLRRIWSLRAGLSAYDASYVALAEALGAPLLTCDARLARAHGHGALVELVE